MLLIFVPVIGVAVKHHRKGAMIPAQALHVEDNDLIECDSSKITRSNDDNVICD